MSDADPFDLHRFVQAQEGVHERVRAELLAGAKRSHWMWFVFPQMAGLGSSAMAERFAIRSLGEAEAYLRHPTLGARLVECVVLVNAVQWKTAHDIFGYPDDLKFRSSMTLFARACGGGPFQQALEKYFDGEGDASTLAILSRNEPTA